LAWAAPFLVCLNRTSRVSQWRDDVAIVRGQTSRKKIVEIQSLAADEIERLLARRVVQ
jgi:uncharacterized protein YggU (UPF0235/DUF167 family)